MDDQTEQPNGETVQNMTRQDVKEALGLTERQFKAIPFIISAPTYEEGCKAAQVSKNAF